MPDRYVFYGHVRPIRAYDTTGTVVELRCIPGGLVTWHHVECEAVDLMHDRIAAAVKRGDALDALSDSEAALVGRLMLAGKLDDISVYDGKYEYMVVVKPDRKGVQANEY